MAGGVTFMVLLVTMLVGFFYVRCDGRPNNPG